jgi:chromosome segregation ATPase
MARGRRKVGMIVPITKTDPDRIAEGANIEDYEKMAAKMAASSDDIIDAALDRLEGREPEPKKPQPKTENVEEPAVEERPPLAEEAQNKATVQRTAEAISEINRLKDELSRANATIEKLRAEVTSLNDSAVAAAEKLRPEMNSLITKNDDLILRNSELEFEISRLNAENNALKQRLEAVENQRRLPPQTNSREGYTRVAAGQRSGVRMTTSMRIPNLPPPPKTTMNGYESWN